MITLIF
jgi:ABC-type multidrug transport system ATPase subunit